MTQTPSPAKQSEKRMTIALGLVVVSAIAIALASARSSHGAGAASAEPLPPPSSPTVTPLAEPAGALEGLLSGEVLETIPVSKYTYVRLRSEGARGEIWAAVPSAKVAVGSRVTISNATRMDDFKSVTLGRSFPVIYFGTLGDLPEPSLGEASSPKFPLAGEQEVDPDQELPPGHPDIGNSAPFAALGDSNQLSPSHPGVAAGTRSEPSPHGGPGDSLAGSAAPLPVPRMERAPGGRLIAELIAARHELDGKRVRVRGQVTKVTPDVQGRAFFHLRDGGSSAAGPAADLVVTSVVVPERGQVAIFEGTVRADDDIGIGYKYPVLLEGATIVDH